MQQKTAPAYLFHTVFLILTPVSFVVTYLVSYHFNHIPLWIPYISDTGTRKPESSIFSTLLTVCALFFGICVYIRYLQIANYNFCNPFAKVSHQWNVVATVLGELSAFGLLTVANFQETNCYFPHFSGATVCILCGSAYFVLETWISFNMEVENSCTGIFYFRLTVSVLVVAMNITGIISTVISFSQAAQEIKSEERPWLSTDNGWVFHEISAMCEWGLALSQSLMMLSFVPELQSMHVLLPVCKIKGISDPT